MSKRKCLTMKERVQVIELSETGLSSRKIAVEFGVGRSQVCDILRRRFEILSEYDENYHKNRKRIRPKLTYDSINQQVVRWMNAIADQGGEITEPEIQSKALGFAKDLNISSFKATSKWLANFLHRYKLDRELAMAIDVDESYAEASDVKEEDYGWTDELSFLCQGFDSSDIFSVTESRLLYRNSTTQGPVAPTDILTLVLCCNMTGERLLPMVVGHSKHTKSLGSIPTEKLPVIYRSFQADQSETCLNDEWLQWFDDQMNERNVLLFVNFLPNNYNPTDLKNVTIKQYPEEKSVLICQPLEQGIVQALKLEFRKRQLQHVLDQVELDSLKSRQEVISSIPLLDALYWIPNAWATISLRTISDSFVKCGFVNPENEDFEDENENYFPNHLIGAASEIFDCAEADLLPDIENNLEVDFEAEDNISIDAKQSRKELPCSLKECYEMVEKLKKFGVYHGNSEILDSTMAISEMLSSLKLKSKKSNFQGSVSSAFKNSETGPSSNDVTRTKLKKEKS